jgi:hypothetical protein
MGYNTITKLSVFILLSICILLLSYQYKAWIRIRALLLSYQYKAWIRAQLLSYQYKAWIRALLLSYQYKTWITRILLSCSISIKNKLAHIHGE